MTRPLRFPLALLAPLLACASAGAQAGGADAALGDPTFAVALSDTVRSASIDPALARSARFGARRGGGVAGGYRSVVADFPTGEGSALVYAPIGDLRTGGLQREQVDFHLRYVDADGIATPGPTITYRFVGGLTAATGKPAGGRGRLSSRALPQPSSRPLEASSSRARATSYPSFVGGTDYTAYALTERPAADDRFARTRLYFYDEAGGLPVAARTAVEYQLEFADLLGRRVTTSRYGGVVACAVLTSRRTDRTAALEERGATLTVATYAPDGEELWRREADLPDLRAAYALLDLVVAEDGTALVALERVGWRVTPPTLQDPLIPAYSCVRAGAPDDDPDGEWLETDLLPSGQQLRTLHAYDQDPLPPGIAAAYAEDLVAPIAGLAVLTADAAEPARGPAVLDFDAAALAELPEVAREPGRISNDVSPQYLPTEVRVGADGRLYVLLLDLYRPGTFEDAALLQRRRGFDGFVEGAVVVALPAPGGGAGARALRQEAFYVRMRQRYPGTYDPDVTPFLGATLVPLAGLGGRHGVLYNEEPANLGPQQRRRGRFTAMSFAVPTLAVPTGAGASLAAPLRLETPHPTFAPYVVPARSLPLPGGVRAGFTPLELGFRSASQYGYWRG